MRPVTRGNIGIMHNNSIIRNISIIGFLRNNNITSNISNVRNISNKARSPIPPRSRR